MGMNYQQMGDALWGGQAQLGAQQQQFLGQQNIAQNQLEQDAIYRREAAMQAERDRNSAFWQNFYGSMASAGASMGGMGMKSDARTKQRIAELEDANQALQQQLGGSAAVDPAHYKAQGTGLPSPTDAAAKVKPVTYEYTPEARAQYPGETRPGRQAGVIAQQVEQTPLAPIVHRAGDGTRTIDIPMAATTGLAVGADNARRIKQLEAKLYTQERDLESYRDTVPGTGEEFDAQQAALPESERVDARIAALRAQRADLEKQRIREEALAKYGSGPKPGEMGPNYRDYMLSRGGGLDEEGRIR
jgi:hypothetical protein